MSERWHLQSGEHGGHVPERLMEGSRLDRLRIEQLGPYGVE